MILPSGGGSSAERPGPYLPISPCILPHSGPEGKREAPRGHGRDNKHRPLGWCLVQEGFGNGHHAFLQRNEAFNSHMNDPRISRLPSR
jgi:hypothetical protein